MENLSKEKLYKKALPALNAKVCSMKELGYDGISPDVIWEYLYNNVWNLNTVLLVDMIDDILNTPSYLFKEYLPLYSFNHKLEN